MVAGSDIVEYALAQRGDPYVYGAEGPDTFDCSGLVEYVYKHYGLTTPRTTADMISSSSNLTEITRAQLQPGDLIFSNWIGRNSSHVGIYAGGDQIIEAPEPGKTVMVSKLGPAYWSHVDNLRRVPGVDGSPGTIPADLSSPGEVTNKLFGWIPTPATMTEAATNIGTSLGSVAQSAMSVSKLAQLATRAFLPSNLLRGFALLMGVVFVLIGIWFLAREVRDS